RRVTLVIEERADFRADEIVDPVHGAAFRGDPSGDHLVVNCGNSYQGMRARAKRSRRLCTFPPSSLPGLSRQSMPVKWTTGPGPLVTKTVCIQLLGFFAAAAWSPTMSRTTETVVSLALPSMRDLATASSRTEPTTIPSACLPISAASSAVLMPKPTATGRSV